ncbi:MAG: hypothetical protein LBF78_12765 [Treponema sp.]|jgi:hypothetical protein|nr:hypothetical protein [Treponema sp.]
MKKFFAALIITIAVTGALAAQEFKVSGEIKTGFFWYDRWIGDHDHKGEGYVHNSEDDDEEQRLFNKTAKNQGRFRMNLWLDNGNTGMKVRFEQTEWSDTAMPKWSYAFAYGNFLNDQLKISIGRLGDSPYGTGGPEMWKELDTRIGIRTEILPAIVPGLNAGFVLNDMSDQQSYYYLEPQTIVDIFKETVLGLAYTHDFFELRMAYRLDSEFDEDMGDKLIYRIEERALQNILPGFQVWANGSWEGLRHEDEKALWLINWLYIQYAPELFTAQLRLGYDAYSRRSVFYARPSLYFNLFDNFLNAGASFEFAQDFGEGKYYKDSPYLRMVVEPQVRVNFSSAYVAMVYQYRNEYHTIGVGETYKIHAVNLRVVYTF